MPKVTHWEEGPVRVERRQGHQGVQGAAASGLLSTVVTQECDTVLAVVWIFFF